MKVWVTRAQPGAAGTAAALRARGHDPLVAPLLVVEPVADARVQLEGIAALAFTSANAVAAFAALSERRDLPAFAVGGATAGAAREAGLEVRAVGCGDSAALARAIALHAPALRGTVLHPGAETLAGDLVGELTALGVRARATALYRTSAVDALPEAVVCAAAEGALAAVLLHSPRAGRTLARLLTPGLLAGVRLLGLSHACLAPLADADAKAAATPDEAALLVLLDRR